MTKTRKQAKTPATRYVRFVTKRQLVQAQRQATKWDFNRQIHPDLDLGNLGNYWFPIMLSFPHNHRRMEKCEPHVRIEVYVPDHAWNGPFDSELMFCPEYLLFDVPEFFFAKIKGEQMSVPA